MAGIIVLQEGQLYKAWELILITGCGCISIGGVWVIVKKPQAPSKEKPISVSSVLTCKKRC